MLENLRHAFAFQTFDAESSTAAMTDNGATSGTSRLSAASRVPHKQNVNPLDQIEQLRKRKSPSALERLRAAAADPQMPPPLFQSHAPSACIVSSERRRASRAPTNSFQDAQAAALPPHFLLTGCVVVAILTIILIGSFQCLDNYADFSRHSLKCPECREEHAIPNSGAKAFHVCSSRLSSHVAYFSDQLHYRANLGHSFGGSRVPNRRPARA